MRTMIFVISAVLAFAFTASTANAEMLRCARIVNGMCDTGPARMIHPRRAPIFALGVQRDVDDETPDSDVIAGGPRHHDRCHGGIFVNELNACDKHGPPTAELKGDPECKNQPSGHRFDREVTGPHGERMVDHRVCW